MKINMEGKLIKENNGYTLFVDGKVFGDTDRHQLKSITNRLSLKNCQTIANGCDLDELVNECIKNTINQKTGGDIHKLSVGLGFKKGFQKALEILSDKKYSEEDVKKIIHWSTLDEDVRLSEEELFKSLQQTEWDVEVVMVKEHIGSGCYKKYPKLDDEGCLILKKYKNG